MTHFAREDPGPFEVILLAFVFVGRLASLVSDGPPGIVERVLGDELIFAWSMLLLVGPVIALIGIFWPGRPSTSRAIEQFGLIPVAGASLIYAAVLTTQFGKTDGAFTTTAFVAGYGIASVWRIFQIFRVQREDIRRSKLLNGDAE